MDYFAEDIIAVVRFVLDYVGFDIDNWDFHWPSWRRDIRHRSLVRVIGTYLIQRKARRINFQQQLIGCGRRHHARCDSMESIISLNSDTVLDEDVWIEEELADGCVQIRARHRDDFTLANCTEIENGAASLQCPPRRTSTPVNSGHRRLSVGQRDVAATSKISALEDELSKLREQIALIVVNQEQGSIMQTQSESVMEATECRIATDQKISTLGCVSQPDVVRHVPVQIPPPLPPLPQLPQQPPNHEEQTTPITAATEPSAENKDICVRNIPEQAPSVATIPLAVSMSDILKDISNVKLKAVKRSPGGTPLRRKPRPAVPIDPASVITLALRNKFAHRRVAFESPTTDKENSSAECSPCTPVETRGSRKSKSWKFERRRSDLCMDSTNAQQALSPLTEVSLQ